MKNLRLEFADTLEEVGEIDQDLVVLVGDISHGILQNYAKKCPYRYYNVGICEPTIVNMAAGLSKLGLTPVVHTIAPFIIERAYEQIKLDFGYQQESINLITVGGAFDYSHLGCSHHCYTDVSLIAHLKNSSIILPGSPIEFNYFFKKFYKNGNINYFKLTEHPHEVLFEEKDLAQGKAIKVKNGSDITIVTIGAQLKTVLQTLPLFENLSISVEVIYYPVFKPFDSKTLYESVQKTRRVICIEELSAHDGLFNQVIKSCLILNNVQYIQLAIEDFIHEYGSYADLCEIIGFTPQGIIKTVRNKFSDLFERQFQPELV